MRERESERYIEIEREIEERWRETEKEKVREWEGESVKE